jgi:hypothetical protein
MQAEKKKVMVSLTAHESELALIDQCMNYLWVGGVDGVVIHINAHSNFHTERFIAYCRCMSQWFEGKIFINPYGVGITPHSQDVRIVTNLHRAHISNFLYLTECGVNFDHFALDASNSLLIRPGLSQYIQNAPCNLLEQAEMPKDWSWLLFVLADENLARDVAQIKISGHEGSCYQRDVFQKIVKSIMAYEFAEQSSILSGRPRVEYPREEVLFASYFFKYFKDTPTQTNYIDLPWHRYLVWHLDEVKNHIASHFENFKHKYGIKRVARDFNDPIRAFIGKTYGYRDELLAHLPTDTGAQDPRRGSPVVSSY